MTPTFLGKPNLGGESPVSSSGKIYKLHLIWRYEVCVINENSVESFAVDCILWWIVNKLCLLSWERFSSLDTGSWDLKSTFFRISFNFFDLVWSTDWNSFHNSVLQNSVRPGKSNDTSVIWNGTLAKNRIVPMYNLIELARRNVVEFLHTKELKRLIT